MINKLFAKVILSISFIFSFLSLISPVSASGGCVPVYGGGVECPRAGQVLIDKKVLNPATGQFVDNLTPTDPKYRPEQIVTFRLIVKNSGDQNLDSVLVTDNIPQFVEYIPNFGNYDQNSKTVTFTVDNLAAGTSQQFDLKARVVHPILLPAEKNIICPVNVVTASANSQTDRDEAQFCIEKQVTVPQVPTAGPEHWIFLFAGLSAAFVLGRHLQNKAII